MVAPINQSLMHAASITPVKTPCLYIDTVDWNHDNYPQRIKNTNHSAYPALGSEQCTSPGRRTPGRSQGAASILTMGLLFGRIVLDGSTLADQSRTAVLTVWIREPVGSDFVAFLSWTCRFRSQLTSLC